MLSPQFLRGGPKVASECNLVRDAIADPHRDDFERSAEKGALELAFVRIPAPEQFVGAVVRDDLECLVEDLLESASFIRRGLARETHRRVIEVLVEGAKLLL